MEKIKSGPENRRDFPREKAKIAELRMAGNPIQQGCLGDLTLFGRHGPCLSCRFQSNCLRVVRDPFRILPQSLSIR